MPETILNASKRRRAAQVAVLLASVLATILLAACASGGAGASSSQEGAASSKAAASAGGNAFTDLSAYPVADMSTYDCAADYQGTYHFADMTVRQVADEMEKGATMVVYAGYNHCPWCNSILNRFNDIVSARGITVAYIDTRKDPAWQNNMEIDDYDLLVELFGDGIEEDGDGKKHLYVPELFFVKDGKMVAYHPGTVEGQQNPTDEMTPEQVETYEKTINGYLDQLAS